MSGRRCGSMDERPNRTTTSHFPTGESTGASTICRRDFLSTILAVSVMAQKSNDLEGQLSASHPAAGNAAAMELAKRVLGARAEAIAFETIDGADGLDVFEIAIVDHHLVVRGNTPVSQARGLNEYLQKFCNAQVSWTGDQLNLPNCWPTVPQRIRTTCLHQYRYYLNYCTFSYTMAFWDWPRWEREIDWMALNGVNLVLAAVIGQECVWQSVLRRMGQSEQEIRAFIPGPAFTPFLQMGNLQGWGGPVSQALIDRRVELQVKILRRMRALGIQPVLQGFYGIVPTTLKKRYPQARIIDTGKWVEFQRPDMLVPGDPLFANMAGIWYEEQRKLFGDVEHFAGDPFHEGTAPDIDLGEAGRAIHSAMQKAQPGAVWVLQAWQSNPRKELLKGTVKEKTLILDLYGEDSRALEKRNGFDGHPWVWCIVNGFGGKVGLYGQWQKTAQNPIAARNWGRMSGIGALMEGTIVDYPTYQLLYDMAWRADSPDLTWWAESYATQRYGSYSAEAETSWILLKDTAYGVPPADEGGQPEPVFCARPDRNIMHVSTWGTIERKYDPAVLVEAWHLLLSAVDIFGKVPTFRYDLVDVTRQVLSNLGLEQYHRMEKALQAKDPGTFKREASLFLEMILDQDRLLATQQQFLLGKWISEARGLGTTVADKDLLEQNARTVITVWGPEVPAQSLHDYSNREWSGLLTSFYYERWKLWIDVQLKGLRVGSTEPVDWFKWEEAWTRQRDSFPSTPVGDSVAQAQRIAGKYSTLLKQSAEQTLGGRYESS